jgi:hypothetical protein
VARGEKKKKKNDGYDPRWPAESYADGHAVSELASDRQGSLSPFGEEEFPVPAETLPYVHPVTVVNR